MGNGSQKLRAHAVACWSALFCTLLTLACIALAIQKEFANAKLLQTDDPVPWEFDVSPGHTRGMWKAYYEFWTPWPFNLANQCTKYSPEIYLLFYDSSFRFDKRLAVYAHSLGGKATMESLVVETDVGSKFRSLSWRPTKSNMQIHVNMEQMTQIRSSADRLFKFRIPAVRHLGGLDGDSLFLEMCRGGRYAFFYRWSPTKGNVQDAPFIELVDTLLRTTNQELYDGTNIDVAPLTKEN